MGTTNSTDKQLNYYNGGVDDNSGVEDCVYTNTGNLKRKKGLPVNNDTYTLNAKEDVVINATLLNYSDVIEKEGKDISSTLVSDQWYDIIGHPDKFIYDYDQDYNNCGVVSSLNVLSMAGVKEIVQKDSQYSSFTGTPTVTTREEIVLNEETNAFEYQTVTITTYPESSTPTEDLFTLWAVQNSKNDTKWYEDKYQNDGDIQEIAESNPTDFCVHSMNYNEYKTISDLKGMAQELGGTSITNRDNILEYWGVKADALISPYRHVAKQENAMTTEPEKVLEEPWGDGGVKVVTKTVTTSADFKTVTTVTETKYYTDAEQQNQDGKTRTETVIEYKRNQEWYDFALTFEQLIKDGKGVILSGHATTNYAGPTETEKPAPHAITLLGLVRGQVLIKEEIDSNGNHINQKYDNDIVGFYVVDSGGWLPETEGAQFVTPEQLYGFLTCYQYVGSEEEMQGDSAIYTPGKLNVTQENIKEWAFNTNLNGNNRKNVLTGNEFVNTLKGNRGNDVLRGMGGNDQLYGEADNDTLFGGSGDDLLVGGAGHDTYIFRATDKSNHDVIQAGSGKDKIQFDNFYEHKEDEENNITRIFYHSIQPIMDVKDEDGNVITPGMKYQNILGDLVIEYTSKTEELDAEGNVINTENFESTLTIKDYFKKSMYTSIQLISEAHHDILTNKINYVNYNFVNDFIELKGEIDYFVYEDKENKITGSRFRDSIVGGNKEDSISAADNDDILNGGYCNDTIKAGKGDDKIYASHGNDVLYGDAGNDNFYYDGDPTTFNGDDTIYSGSGEDYIHMTNLTLEDLTFTKQGNNLVINYNDKGDSITIASYFSKKGNTSIKGIYLADQIFSFPHKYQYLLSEVANTPNVVINDTKNKVGTTLGSVDNVAHDSIKAGSGNDTIIGSAGFDTIYGGNGDDVINGGSDSDKLYGQAGNNTYVFALADGYDTITTQGKGTTTLDFSDSGLTFDTTGASGAINEHSYTKVKNDLLINYAQSHEEDGNATVRIANYFNSANEFTLKWGEGEDTLNLKDVYIYMNGNDLAVNKITGSKYNDSIVTYDFNDVVKAGAGNDIIYTGKGNDTITGGAGKNEFTYKRGAEDDAIGDGQDTIYLTKKEDLTINLEGYNYDELSIDIVKNDLVISTKEVDNLQEVLIPVITIKNFGKSDVTGVDGKVTLNTDDTTLDLREGYFLDPYMTFTSKKYSYTGNWHTEIIDGRILNNETIVNRRGISVNANAGHDTIYGTQYNDTLNGGNGDDVIYTDYGKNTANGGNGNDTYHIFKFAKELSEKETTTIKDSGKAYEKSEEIDTVIINDEKENVTYDVNNVHNTGKIWFNITNTGKATFTINVEDKDGNTAKITGVEKIIANGGTVDDTSDDLQFNFYNNDELIQDVVAWLTDANHSYKDVATAIAKGDPNDVKELYAIFTNAWGEVTTTV